MREPLYILAEKRALPDHQCIDRETLAWIIDKGGYDGISLSIEQQRLARQVVRRFRDLWKYLVKLPLEDGYYERGLRARNTIHGDLHAYRVSLFAALLSGPDWMEAGAIAGLYHDIARLNDKADEGHGRRSAERVELLGLAPYPFGEQIRLAISRHELDDPGLGMGAPVGQAVKTADALDRYRLPKLKWWPDKRYMNNAPDDIMFTVAYWLVIESERAYLLQPDSIRAIEIALDVINERLA